jgi:hypothetical protein
VDLDFTGDVVDVAWSMSAEAAAAVLNFDVLNHQSGTAFATAQFSHTLSWGGITSVTDADTGQPITDCTLTSASGFDYTHPFAGPGPEPAPASVPEPSSMLLMAPCLGLMLLWRSGNVRRERRRHRNPLLGGATSRTLTTA